MTVYETISRKYSRYKNLKELELHTENVYILQLRHHPVIKKLKEIDRFSKKHNVI